MFQYYITGVSQMSIKKRMLSFCLIASLIILQSINVASYGNIKQVSAIPSGQTFQGETIIKDPSGTLTLTADTENGQIEIYDELTGITWRSNPQNADSDPLTLGTINETRIKSQLLFTYKGDGNDITESNYFDSSPDSNTITGYKTNNSVTMLYHYDDLGFDIPLTFTLKNRALSASIPCDQIKENKINKLITISMIPYFGSGDSDEKGYMMIPDGSGAIINFNNGKSGCGRIDLPVYGGDRSVVEDNKYEDTQPVMFPVFGIYKEEQKNNGGPIKNNQGNNCRPGGIFAVASSGEANGVITAKVSGSETSSNNVYFTFAYRQYGTSVTLDRTWQAKSQLMLSKNNTGAKDFTVDYYFLGSNKSAITQMADTYRNVLELNGLEKKPAAERPLFLDVYGGVVTKLQFMGFVYNGLKPLTTFNQASKIIKMLQSKGINNIQMRYSGVDNDGAYYGKIDGKISLANKLGGIDQFQKLQSINGLAVYPEVELTEFTKNGNGFTKFFDASSSVIYQTIKRYDYQLATGAKNTSLPEHYLLEPEKIDKAASSLEKSLKQNAIDNIAPSSLGLNPYPDFKDSNHNTQINQTEKDFIAALKTISADHRTMLDAPSAFALPYASSVMNVPIKSSGYDLTDYDIPFVQMVLGSDIPYSTPPVNLAGDPETMLLKSIESGSSLNFDIMWNGYSDVEKTPLNYLYASTFSDQLKMIVGYYDENKEALKGTASSSIANYVIVSETLRETTFSNGIIILVNYGDRATTYDHVTVQPHSYARIGGSK